MAANDPVIVEFSRFAREGDVLAVEVKTNRGDAHWLRLTENAALMMVTVLSRLIASNQQPDRLTLKVTGSETTVRADGRKAILLKTQELGPIAFELPDSAISILQGQLAGLQAIQSSPSSH
jgi:hypothetical protein